MTKRISASIGILVLLLGLSFAAIPGKAEAKRWDDYATVRIDGAKIIPAQVVVTAGTTVRWVNFDEQTHDITSGAAGKPDGRFHSGKLEQDGFYEVTLNRKGTYPFYSSTNPAVRGVVVVK